MTERRPAEVFHPGEYLLDMITERGWTQTEFAEIIGRPLQLVNSIINKKRGITTETAQEIGAALGTSAKLWLNLDNAYNLWKSERDLDPIEQQAKLRSKYPIRDMLSRNWLQPTESIDILTGQVLDFFEIANIDDQPKLAQHVIAKRSNSEDEEISPVQLAWLYRTKQVASLLKVPKYSKTKLQKAVKKMMELRTEPELIRLVPKLLEECGVRFLIVEALPSSKIDGVCFWLNANSPVIGMTLRFDRIDNFWFVLRHEIEHVLNEDGKNGVVLDSDIFQLQGEANLAKQERIANSAAAEFCTPQDQLDNLIARHDPYFSRKHILGFAKRVNVHPGLVVGQLQRKTDRYELFRNTLAPIRNIIIPVSLTDGFGNELPVLIQ